MLLFNMAPKRKLTSSTKPKSKRVKTSKKAQSKRKPGAGVKNTACDHVIAPVRSSERLSAKEKPSYAQEEPEGSVEPNNKIRIRATQSIKRPVRPIRPDSKIYTSLPTNLSPIKLKIKCTQVKDRIYLKNNMGQLVGSEKLPAPLGDLADERPECDDTPPVWSAASLPLWTICGFTDFAIGSRRIGRYFVVPCFRASIGDRY